MDLLLNYPVYLAAKKVKGEHSEGIAFTLYFFRSKNILRRAGISRNIKQF